MSDTVKIYYQDVMKMQSMKQQGCKTCSSIWHKISRNDAIGWYVDKRELSGAEWEHLTNLTEGKH